MVDRIVLKMESGKWKVENCFNNVQDKAHLSSAPVGERIFGRTMSNDNKTHLTSAPVGEDVRRTEGEGVKCRGKGVNNT